MTNIPLVMARFKGGDPSQPRFTRSCTIDELMVEINKSVPVDEVYFVVPYSDGKGFSLRAAGNIVLDIQSGLLPQASAPSPLPIPEQPIEQPILPTQQAQEQPQEPKPTSDYQPPKIEATVRPPRARKSRKQEALEHAGTMQVTGVIPATPESIEHAALTLSPAAYKMFNS